MTGIAPAPLIRADRLGVRFGPGCRACTDGLPDGQNHCPDCGSVYALRDVSFAVGAGETLGVVGESGSGKTTLLRVLNQQQEPTGGALHLDGRPAQTRPTPSCVRHRDIVMVQQNTTAAGLHPDLAAQSSVAERLLRTGEHDFDTIAERSAQMLCELAIPAGRHNDPLRTFSGGMQQRVQLARALVDPPLLLLLDEPTTGLDSSVQAELLVVIALLRSRMDAATIIVSHDLDVVRILADRVLVMRHGQVVEEGIPDQLLNDPAHPYTRLLVNSRLS